MHYCAAEDSIDQVTNYYFINLDHTRHPGIFYHTNMCMNFASDSHGNTNTFYSF